MQTTTYTNSDPSTQALREWERGERWAGGRGEVGGGGGEDTGQNRIIHKQIHVYEHRRTNTNMCMYTPILCANYRHSLLPNTRPPALEHSEIYRGLREDIGMKTYVYGPMDYAKKLKLRFRVGDMYLPERKRYTSSREEESVAANMCPCGTAIEGRTHIEGEHQIYEE